MSSFKNLALELERDLTALLQEVTEYLGSDCQNAAQAQRIRVGSISLAKLSKDFRKESVAHHKAK